MQALGLKFETPVLNESFQQREKFPFPCDSVTGMVHPAKYPYPSCSGVHFIWVDMEKASPIIHHLLE